MTSLSLDEKLDWLRLARTQNVGPVTFTALLARFGSAGAALRAIPKLAERGGARGFRICSLEEAESEMEGLTRLGGSLIASCEPEYPRGLIALDPPPPVISVLGRTGLLARETIAIVGARNASALGRKFAGNLAADLSRAGLVVVSGMARGIDTAAHEASLSGGTCAVLAGGIDVIYPRENTGLYERLSREGVIVSEMPLHECPQARHFPRRNRIISGLCRGTVIVEASEASGSLITAQYALEQGREVFAVPGSPLDPRARGSNRLIREGATLVESAEDILQVLTPVLGLRFRQTGVATELKEDRLEPEYDTGHLQSVLAELLGQAPVEIDELVRQSGASAAAVSAVLLEMELAGFARRHPGNRISLG